MKKAFILTGIGKSLIETKVYNKSRLPKNVPKYDIIRLTTFNCQGEKFIDCFIYPEEAILIASALTRAYTVAYLLNKHKVKPK